MQPRRVRHTHDQPLLREDARDRLTPRLGARGMHQAEAVRLQLGGGGRHGVRALHLELDAGLRHGPVAWPLRRTEAGLGRLGQRPHAEVLAPADLLAGPVLAPAPLEGQAQRVEVSLRLSPGSGAMTLTLAMNSTSILILLLRIVERQKHSASRSASLERIGPDLRIGEPLRVALTPRPPGSRLRARRLLA